MGILWATKHSVQLMILNPATVLKSDSFLATFSLAFLENFSLNADNKMKRGTLETNSTYASRGDAWTKKCSNSGSIVNRCGWSSKYFINNGKLYNKAVLNRYSKSHISDVKHIFLQLNKS